MFSLPSFGYRDRQPQFVDVDLLLRLCRNGAEEAKQKQASQKGYPHVKIPVNRVSYRYRGGRS